MSDSQSILDKILQSKEIDEIEQFRPQENVEILLKYLSTREKDVLRRRFGLSGNKKETLEKIGESYKVTRERVRQIETIAVKKIRTIKQFDELTKPLAQTIISVLQKHGGIMREDLLLHELLRLSGDTDESRQCVLFLLEKIFQKSFKKIEESESFYASWHLPGTQFAIIEDALSTLRHIFVSHGQPMHIQNIVSDFKNSEFSQKHSTEIEEDALQSYLDISKKVAKNPYDEYGLVDWPMVSPKRMNDKIFLVLKKNGKPMHFNAITEMINRLKFDDRPAYAPTVHNELILNSQYVLVGRGIYALKEWGYKPGVVADVIIDILAKAGTALPKDQIIQRVLEQRMVKRNTIQLALTDKRKFTKLPDGTYSLTAPSSQQE